MRDEGGLLFREIAAELGIPYHAARHAYGWAKADRPGKKKVRAAAQGLPLETASGTMWREPAEAPRPPAGSPDGCCAFCPLLPDCRLAVGADDYAGCEAPLEWELEGPLDRGR